MNIKKSTAPPVSTICKMIPDYLMSESERTMFDWLLTQQHFFAKDIFAFNMSVRRIVEMTGIKKTKVKSILDKFSKDGWLIVSKGNWKNNPHTNLFVDFGLLIKEKQTGNKIVTILEKYIKKESETYNNLDSWLREQQELQIIDDDEVNDVIDKLQGVLDARIDFYNEHHANKIIHKALPLSDGGERRIRQFIRDSWWFGFESDYNDEKSKLIIGFVSFCDCLLAKKIKTNDPVKTYLWKSDNGRYECVEGNYSAACNYDYLNPVDYPDYCGIE